MYEAAARADNDQLQVVLIRRARRWNHAVPEAVVGAWLSWARLSPPLELLVSAAYAAMYAWCTASRFGLRPVPCRYGCGEEAGDRQTHYLACPVARTFALRYLPLLTTADEPHAHDCILRKVSVRGLRAMQAAVFMHAVL